MNTQLDRDRARAGRPEGVVRWVLIWGLVLVILAFIVAWFLGAFGGESA
jgi:hypothetical protein